MTPRLAATREQAVRLGPWTWTEDETEPSTVTLRLTEQPTMPCPECGGYATDRWRCDGVEVAVVCNYCNGGAAVPIPEGTRVEVGWWDEGEDWWEQVEDGHGLVDEVFHPASREWHPVATATVGEVLAPLYDDDFWIVVLTDVEVTDG